MSFFDESDEPTRVTRQPRRSGGGGGDGGGQRPPREPTRRPDRQTVRVRQAVGLGVALLLVIVVVLGVKGCVSSQKENSLKAYNRDVTSVISSSDRDVGQALFRPARQRLPAGAGPAGAGQSAAPRRRRGRPARTEVQRAGRHEGRPGQAPAHARPPRRGPAQDRRRPADGARARPGRADRGRPDRREHAVLPRVGRRLQGAGRAADQADARRRRRDRPADRRQPVHGQHRVAQPDVRRPADRRDRRRREPAASRPASTATASPACRSATTRSSRHRSSTASRPPPA